MDNQTKEITGAWLVAIGTIIYAIGSTPFPFINEERSRDLIIIGNALQAAGNVLEAEGQDEFSLETLGNELQATGNVTVIAGLSLPLDDDTMQKTVIAGTWIQALGGFVAFGDELADTTNTDDIYLINGNLLQAIGNSLQAGSATDTLIREQLEETAENDNAKTGDQNRITVAPLYLVGVWIQTVGSVLALIGQIKEESEEQSSLYQGSTMTYADWLAKTKQSQLYNL
ncbi:DUF6944 family repetitive protein [Peribacillus faecalis]|uniref:DUF6944 family repetitive protein n=1 Tax=Peribacillus faecalis TaxID=2772559 RepID=UPI001F2F0648|nr:hypothetical protein [Peribacillus faecalis]